jgi:hypothetical protein
MTKKSTHLEAVERAVAAFEALALGDAFADAHEAAEVALLELRNPAIAALFARFVPASADMIALFEFLEVGWARAAYVDRLADLHADCCAAEPKLAAFLRSGAIMDRVASMGAEQSVAIAKPAAQVADEFTDRYVKLIAFQLSTGADADLYQPHASILSEHAPAFAVRIAACRARHDEHLAAERAQMEREQAEAAEAIAAEDRRRYAVVAEYFASRPGHRFLVRDRVFSGAGLSESASRGAPLLEHEAGEIIRRTTIDELELAMKRAQAAEAVAV